MSSAKQFTLCAYYENIQYEIEMRRFIFYRDENCALFLMQVGTEDVPFEHKAIITLHGHHRSRELPIYGTKVLAVRNGSLELHG